ncbi:MAG: efflux RND transporter permease subunit, partial [Chlamydiae bacterium]|nr:efflux RND transporter permease subunit [Chlamydiota bacterium]
FGLGQFGQEPATRNTKLTVPLTTTGRLSTPEQFENIVLRATLNGEIVLLKDVAQVTLGSQDYSVDGSINTKSTILLTIYQQYGANALDVANSVKSMMEKISKRFPEGITYSIPYDTTLFIKMSIKEVFITMVEAALLVIMVVFIFLQSLRATLIPVLALIVSIVGTFSGMYVLGFSINTLTLFGMVLAIGIVVDDAIVVVENVERNLRSFNYTPIEAAKKAMEEVTGPVIAIVFVLCAVFVPVAFLGGIAGQLYKQFAMTIAISVFFSGIIALTLSPAIAAIILQKNHKEHKLATQFNKLLDSLTNHYVKLAGVLIEKTWLSYSIFLLILGLVTYFYITTPTSFVPDEDQGYVIALTNLSDGASLERTLDVDKKIAEIAMNHPAVENVVGLTGFSLLESINRTNIGTNFITLKDWSQRKAKNLQADAVLKSLQKEYDKIEEGLIHVVNPPAIQGLGTVGGLEFWIENRGDGGLPFLQEVVLGFIEKAKERKEIGGLFTTAEFNNLQFFVDLDRYKAKA